jgi:hypothetical protein
MTDVDTGLRDIAEIRSIMERSTKFLSLSGFAGIGAGLVALAGAWAAGAMLAAENITLSYATSAGDLASGTTFRLLLLGITVLLLALAIVWFFSRRIIRRRAGQLVHGPVMRQLILAFAVPFVTGICMTLLLFYHAPLWTVAPSMLVFYGIGVFSAGSYTFSEVRTLGMTQILLGLAACLVPEYGVILWAAGFGLVHCLYGALFFRKYRQ